MRRSHRLSVLLLVLVLTGGCGQGGERETAGRQEAPGGGRGEARGIAGLGGGLLKGLISGDKS